MVKNTDETAQNFLKLYQAHQSWSEATFGTEKGPIGPLHHLIDEAQEAIECPDDITEYVDCLFLITDAARRAGFELDELVSAGFDKLEVLKGRNYKRTPEGEPSYHEK
ncbi:dATP/dGTP pyrophosphohydrolase domain-containing protein [Kiloniella majae]|uniref:dATP/dGTP pyrophosphohydrolase domain-containing protein n=1 Tax=Kiloniella majae TaxID=1938558 RepID=UPI000A2778CD|nr:dATP/dGTP pyrophosphohydrolase domain-containing protein [Kiloniella majae]